MGRQWYLYHLVSHFVHLFFWTSGCTSWKMSTSSRMASKISRAIRSGTWTISNKFCVEAGSNHTKLLESVSTCWKCPRKWPWQELSNRIATLRLATGVYMLPTCVRDVQDSKLRTLYCYVGQPSSLYQSHVCFCRKTCWYGLRRLPAPGPSVKQGTVEHQEFLLSLNTIQHQNVNFYRYPFFIPT